MRRIIALAATAAVSASLALVVTAPSGNAAPAPSVQAQVNTLKSQVATLQKQVTDLQRSVGDGGFDRFNYRWGTAWDEIKKIHADIGLDDSGHTRTSQRLYDVECKLAKLTVTVPRPIC